MESSTAQFLSRQFACAQLPNARALEHPRSGDVFMQRAKAPDAICSALALTRNGIVLKSWRSKPKRQPASAQLGGVASFCHPSGSWLVKFRLLCYVLPTALRACPDQVGTQQGQLGGS